MSRRIRFLLVALSAVVATAAPAAADAPTNAHNCTGAFSSGVTPEFVSQPPGAFGEFVSTQAQSQTRDEFVTGITESTANCGTTP